MLTLITYEFKNRKKNFLFILFSAIWLLLIFLLFMLFASFTTQIAQYINSQSWIQTLLGITEQIEFINYETAITTAAIPLVIAMFYHTIVSTANSIISEETQGTLIYFINLPISKNKLLISKIIVCFLELIINQTILNILIWKLSSYGAIEHEFFQLVLKENLTARITAFSLASFISFTIGILYGCTSRKKRAAYFTCNILFFSILFSIIPNIFKTIQLILTENNYNVTILTKPIQSLMNIRKFLPTYWSYPFAAPVLQLSGKNIIMCLFTTLTVVILCTLFYNKKNYKFI